MSNDTPDIEPTGAALRRTAIDEAKAEIEKEDLKKAVTALKAKYRELREAETVVRNINREIADLELQIEQGNL